MVERMRRLRMSLASSSPGASGDIARPNYVGPSGNGLVERMKAGESPWDQGRSNGHPCPFPEGGPEDEGRTPQWSAARRTPCVIGRAPQGDQLLSRASRRSAPSRLGSKEMPAHPAPRENRGGGALAFFARRLFET